MSNDETSGQESDGRTDLEITVCANGVVNVHRPESDRAHSVMLDEHGDVVRCSCKGFHFRGECSHADAIERRPLVVSSALAATATGQRVATDGGREQLADEDENERDSGVNTFEIPAGPAPRTLPCVRCEREPDASGEIDHAPGCPVRYVDESTDGRTCDECGASLDGDENHPHESGCTHARGVVDPYAGENEEVDETPL